MTIFIPAWNKGTLEPVEKLEVHKRGLKHKAISIFVFCGGKLLIQQRASNKYHSPELWANSCCSHPNWGESSEDCSSRRIFEELGLKIYVYLNRLPSFRPNLGVNNRNWPKVRVNDIYLMLFAE